mmetsp:Transcript_1663/g.2487  ORF Transcript_1663/g.2487 Transcript_1663/m.2487 type:complete len:258 (+) Transcript_1663:29-802(+)
MNFENLIKEDNRIEKQTLKKALLSKRGVVRKRSHQTKDIKNEDAMNIDKRGPSKKKRLANTKHNEEQMYQNKKGPKEMDASKPMRVHFHDKLLSKSRYNTRPDIVDPRMRKETLSYVDKKKRKQHAAYDPRYEFLIPMLEKDIHSLKEDLKEAKANREAFVDANEREMYMEKIKRKLNQVQSRYNSMIKGKKKREIRDSFKKLKNEKKHQYHLSDQQIEMLLKKEKFDELKKSGKLQSYLNKKRKRNTARDRKTMFG